MAGTYDFVTLDVFTDRRFGGNPLAVFADARGLDTATMQALAGEFNLSETTFVLPPDDPSTRAEILLLSSSILVPCLTHQGIRVWDTLAIAEYLNEVCPEAQLLPADAAARAHCRAVSGEMHSGFAALRASLPMNLRAHFPKFKVWSRAQADIDRITAIWRDCLHTYGGPFLFGAQRTVADAMYAPVCTRFVTYDVKLDAVCQAYCQLMLSQPEMKAWHAAALKEPADIDELDVEF